jgi:cyclic 2,3-diphosphoglycerate synthase
VVVVDGEHYPPVVRDAVAELRSSGAEVLAAILAGGREKLPATGSVGYGPFEVRAGDDPRSMLDDALVELAPDVVIDLADEPVLDYRMRHELVSVSLFRGVAYQGPGFRFDPPPRPSLCAHPSLAIIGTGKRTGKTAVAGAAARHLAASGFKPVVVAMGRGGPPKPEVVRGDEITLTPRALMSMADEGRHAASDYIEDALLARVPTVGCRRCGGGLAGSVDTSNVADGIAMANELPGDLLILEGSGSAIPPARADATGLVVPATITEEHLRGYFGLYRVLLADFAVVTMCEYPFGSPSHVSATTSRLRDAWRPGGKGGGGGSEFRVVRTVFRPTPTGPVDGASAFVATTAPEPAGESIRRHLEGEHRCRVVGISHSLSNRGRLEEELRALTTGVDVLLCEIKGAGVDVATREALDAGIDVIYMDNAVVGVGGDEVTEVFERAAGLAAARYDGTRR